MTLEEMRASLQDQKLKINLLLSDVENFTLISEKYNSYMKKIANFCSQKSDISDYEKTYKAIQAEGVKLLEKMAPAANPKKNSLLNLIKRSGSVSLPSSPILSRNASPLKPVKRASTPMAAIKEEQEDLIVAPVVDFTFKNSDDFSELFKIDPDKAKDLVFKLISPGNIV